MRILIYFICIFSLKIFVVSAQVNTEDERFAMVDVHVSDVSKDFVFHPYALAQRLTENLSNDYDKVRAFYVWIAKNVDYDFMAFIHDFESSQSVTEITRSGKALCTGFSLLFQFFCKQAGIEAVIIEGYSKGYGYKKGQRFTRTDHAWNAVNIYGTWYLLDVTWATGDPTNLAKQQKKIDLNTYFLTAPDKFIETHLPEDPTWQLLRQKITLSEFETGEYNSNIDRKFNEYAPKDYQDLNEYDKDLLSYKRALEFNERNNTLYISLSFTYLYKGISLTDELWKMKYDELIDDIDSLEDQFINYMDSARNTIQALKHYQAQKMKRIVDDEINYQKGVFKYELGVELYTKSKTAKIAVLEADNVTAKYFDSAESHFNNVDNTSIYFKDAKEYLALIHEFWQRNPYEPIPD